MNLFVVAAAVGGAWLLKRRYDSNQPGGIHNPITVNGSALWRAQFKLKNGRTIVRYYRADGLLPVLGKVASFPDVLPGQNVSIVEVKKV